MDDSRLTPGVVQRQIDTLREQLYKMNEACGGAHTAAASGAPTGNLYGRRPGGGHRSTSDFTSDEIHVIARNDALRAEKARLLEELRNKEPPALKDKKNMLRDTERNIEEVSREVERLAVIRGAMSEEAAVVIARQRELQALQSSCSAEASDFRAMQREMQARVKECEKKMLSTHVKHVKLRQRIQLGVPEAEAQKLRDDVARQEREISEMEDEVRRRRVAQQRAAAAGQMQSRPSKSKYERTKELEYLQDCISRLEGVLQARDMEFRRSYDYAGRMAFAAAQQQVSKSKTVNAAAPIPSADVSASAE